MDPITRRNGADGIVALVLNAKRVGSPPPVAELIDLYLSMGVASPSAAGMLLATLEPSYEPVRDDVEEFLTAADRDYDAAKRHVLRRWRQTVRPRCLYCDEPVTKLVGQGPEPDRQTAAFFVCQGHVGRRVRQIDRAGLEVTSVTERSSRIDLGAPARAEAYRADVERHNELMGAYDEEPATV